MPIIAAATSWVDSFKSSMREIRKKHTMSELALLAHRSREQAFNMRKNTPALNNQEKPSVEDDGNAYKLGNDVNNGVAVPKKFINKDGQLDLSLATGDEAVAYMRSLGIKVMPVFH